MLFSIVVPVYNVECFVDKCIKSILDQTFTDYEVIIIDDGSSDNSYKIIDNIVRENCRFHLYQKLNGGLSSARNFGIKKAKGEYLIFIDSDDYIDNDLLLELSKIIYNNRKIDVLRYSKRVIDQNGKSIDEDKILRFDSLSGESAFMRLRKNRITLETAWTYAIKRSYFNESNFVFCEGRVHEDLGLVPDVIVNSECVSAYPTDSKYNYVLRTGSIMSTKNEKANLKKYLDILFYYKEKKAINRRFKVHSCEREYYCYYSEAVIRSWLKLSKEDRKKHRNDIIANRCLSDFGVNSIKNIVKKVYYFLTIFKEGVF